MLVQLNMLLGHMGLNPDCPFSPDNQEAHGTRLNMVPVNSAVCQEQGFDVKTLHTWDRGRASRTPQWLRTAVSENGPDRAQTYTATGVLTEHISD